VRFKERLIYMRSVIVASILVGVFVWGTFSYAEMTSTNFIIRWDTIGSGGSDDSSSASYELRDTIGNTAIGEGTSTSYDLRAGYRQGIFDQIITFDVLAQLRSSGRTATARAGTTISTGTTGLAVGDMIVLIQDEGASQVSAVGRIISIGAGSITVDELKDDGVAPVIDGTNDFVYALTGGTALFDELDPAELATSLVGFDVTADIDGGYVIQVLDDGNLRSGAVDIDDVADGEVTIGSEEYGGQSSDSDVAFGTSDLPFTTSFQDVADESDASFDDRNFITLKASIDGTTQDATYEHILTFIISGNF